MGLQVAHVELVTAPATVLLLMILVMPSYGASLRPRGETLIAPKFRSASRPACQPRQCAITLIREGEILTTNLTVDICKLEYGPLSVYSRCYEQSIPGPTLSLQAGFSVARDGILRVNLKSELQSSEFTAKVANEMIAKDAYGKIETYLTLKVVPFDFIPLAFILVGTAPMAEVMQIRAINSTIGVTVTRGMRQTKMQTHVANTPVQLLDIAFCDVLRQPNRTNLYAHGLHSVQARDLNNKSFVAASSPSEDFEMTLPKNHPRGTFWYSPKYKGSFALQLGGGMAGMLIVEDDAKVTPAALLFMQEIHLVLQHMSFKELPPDHPNRFLYQGFVQTSIYDGANGYVPSFFNFSHPAAITASSSRQEATMTGTASAASDGSWKALFPEYADFTLTNGQYIPHLTLPRGGARRVRIVNAAAAITYELALVCAQSTCTLDSCKTYVMAMDGVYNTRELELVDSIQAGRSLLLFPGSRVDLVLQCSEEVDVKLASVPQTANDVLLGPLALRSQQDLLTISITLKHEILDAQGKVVMDAIPMLLPPIPEYLKIDKNITSSIYDTQVFKYKIVLGGDGTREVPFVNPSTPFTRLGAPGMKTENEGGGTFTDATADKTVTRAPQFAALLPLRLINEESYEAGKVQHCVTPNSIQEWEIQGLGERLSTFTLQGHHFQILETSDGRQAADEGVWRDVYGVSGGSSVVIRFRVTNQTGEYIFGSTIASDHDFGQVVAFLVAETCDECARYAPPSPPACGSIQRERAENQKGSSGCGDELRIVLENKNILCGGEDCVCDDSNEDDGDGCTKKCRVEAGFNCKLATCGVSVCKDTRIDGCWQAEALPQEQKSAATSNHPPFHINAIHLCVMYVAFMCVAYV